MSSAAFVIFAEPHEWTASAVNGDDIQESTIPVGDNSAANVAQQTRDALWAMGYDDQPVVLAIPSQWCLVTALKIDPQQDTNAMAQRFRLEEFLPIAAEEFTAASFPDNDHAGAELVVAAQSSFFTQMLRALDNLGVVIDSICPATILAFQEWRTQNTAVSEGTHAIAWHVDGTIDWLVLRDGAIVDWLWIPAVEEKLLREVDRCELTYGVAPQVVLLSDRNTSHELQVDYIAAPADRRRWGAQAAEKLARSGLPPLNFLKDELAPRHGIRRIRRPLTAAVLTAAFAMAALAGASFYRARMYERIAFDAEQAQTSLYAEVFPNRQVPIDPRLLLSTELRRMKGLGGLDGQAAVRPARSAFHLLSDTLVALPRDIRFRVLELYVDRNRVQLDGQTRNHSDAEVISAALRKTNRFEPDPLRSEQLPTDKGVAGVSFSLAAAVKEAQPPARKRAP